RAPRAPGMAGRAAERFVLPPSAASTLPSPNRPLGPNELDELKSQYADIRSAQWASPVGTARFGAVSFLGRRSLTNILEASWDEQVGKVDELGFAGCFAWADVFFDVAANDAAKRLYAEAIKRVVNDPGTAEDL